MAETFDLARVISAAEGIKNARQGRETDMIRRQYMQNQDLRAGAQEGREQQAFDTENQVRNARSRFLEADFISRAEDPVAAAQQYAPELVRHIEEQNGPGSFAQIPPDNLRKLVAMAREKAASEAGINTQPSPDAVYNRDTALQNREADQTGRIAQIQEQGRQARLTDAQQVRNAPRQITAPPSGYQWTPDGQLAPIKGGPHDPDAKPATLRPIPPAAAQGIIENRTTLNKLDKAIAAVEANPSAFGGWNYLGDAVRQRTDPEGVDPRAKVADIGSLVIHDRSGAAVSASEFPRLAPFVPQATDDPKTVATKLRNMKANLQAITEETESLYSPETGYRPVGGDAQTQGKGASGNWGGPQAGTVEDGYRFKGGNPADRNNWEQM